MERTCDRWFVLSAKHGLVEPDRVLEPYDETLKDASVGDRRRWSAAVLAALDQALGEVRGLIFEAHAGHYYLDFGLADGLRARGADLERPTEHLGLGSQLSFYGRWLLDPGATYGGERRNVMRIVTWNMGFHDFASRHEEAWRYLVDVLAPDLALVQEAVPPAWLEDQFSVIPGIAWEGLPWGSAIVSKVPLKPVLTDSSRGSVVVAELSLNGLSIAVASIHARLMRPEVSAQSTAQRRARVFPALAQTFDMLRPLLRPPFVLGGDLNTFRSAEQRYPGYGHGPFWDELDEHFYDCHWQLHHAEVGSFWGHVARGLELQDDHILVDLATGEAGGVKGSRGIADEEVRQLSDHGPIEAEVVFF